MNLICKQSLQIPEHPNLYMSTSTCWMAVQDISLPAKKILTRQITELNKMSRIWQQQTRTISTKTAVSTREKVGLFCKP